MNPAVFCVPYSTVFTPGCSTNVLDSTDAGTRRTGDVACGAVRACVCAPHRTRARGSRPSGAGRRRAERTVEVERGERGIRRQCRGEVHGARSPDRVVCARARGRVNAQAHSRRPTSGAGGAASAHRRQLPNCFVLRSHMHHPRRASGHHPRRASGAGGTFGAASARTDDSCPTGSC